MKMIIVLGLTVAVLLLSGCVERGYNYDEKYTHIIYGRLKEVWTDTTMIIVDFYNRSGITFYESPNAKYGFEVFELLELDTNYTFVFHLENNVARPGIEMYYIDNAPVIDNINKGLYLDYWIDDKGCIEW